MQSHMILFRSAGRDAYDDDFSVRTQPAHEPIELKHIGDDLDAKERSGIALLKRRAEPAHFKEGKHAKNYTLRSVRYLSCRFCFRAGSFVFDASAMAQWLVVTQGAE